MRVITKYSDSISPYFFKINKQIVQNLVCGHTLYNLYIKIIHSLTSCSILMVNIMLGAQILHMYG